MTALVGAAAASDLSWVNEAPALDDMQAGSLRHLLNRASQLPGDWSGMDSAAGQLQADGIQGLRYQLSYMFYALSVTHVHRLPAASGLFRPALDALMKKMLRPDVWIYWRDASTGGAGLVPDPGPALPSEWDPVGRDNIMYSAYVQSMALLFHHLFDDQTYAQPGALTFEYRSAYWRGQASASYDERTLSEHLYWTMVEKGYLGIACEPDCVFLICNQPLILGLRMHDLVYGGDRATEVSEGWLRAWEEFGGILDPELLAQGQVRFKALALEKERVPLYIPTPVWDFWLATLLHMWSPDLVEEHYPKLMQQWSRPGPDGSRWIAADAPPPEASMFMGGGAGSALGLGWAALCASELGDSESLGELLRYADQHLHATWERGGLYHRRHDETFDAAGRFSAMDPMSGNVLLPFARLNVPHGLRKLYDGAWRADHVKQPTISAVSEGVDLRRAWFDEERHALALTIASAEGGRATLSIDRWVERGEPQVRADRNEATLTVSVEDDLLVVALDGLDRPTNVVLQW
jgi:hypothetical protein